MTTPIDDIHVALTDLTAQVATHAPNLRPTVAPAYLPLHSPTHSLDTLCATKQQSDRVSKWMSKKSSEDSAQIVFVTSVDYPRRRVNVTKVKVVDEVEASLYCLDTVMQSMVTGTSGDFTNAVERFLTVNGYNVEEVATHQHVFNEVYTLSYAMKVLLSNVGGFTAHMGEYTLPFTPEDDIVKALESVYSADVTEEDDDDDNNTTDRIAKSVTKTNSSDDDSDEEVVEEKATKKRKHKRGKKK